jgi:hypothetical protein
MHPWVLVGDSLPPRSKAPREMNTMNQNSWTCSSAKNGTAHTMSLKLSNATKANSQRLAHSLIKDYESWEPHKEGEEWPSASGQGWK